jgi:hypothetical protein
VDRQRPARDPLGERLAGNVWPNREQQAIRLPDVDQGHELSGVAVAHRGHLTFHPCASGGRDRAGADGRDYDIPILFEINPSHGDHIARSVEPTDDLEPTGKRLAV